MQVNPIQIDEANVSSKSTLPRLWWGLMNRPSIITPGRCAVCGKACSPDAHHVVKRSFGNLIVSGRKLKKPTVTLCGPGNAGGCHGLAHAGRLHFRWCAEEVKIYSGRTALTNVGHWEYLRTKEPMKYQQALEQGGWRKL